MVSKQQLKFLCSLKEKKYRKQHQVFTAEGVKLVEEALKAAYPLHSVYGLKEWASENASLLKEANVAFFEVSEKQLKQASALVTPNRVIAVLKIPVVPLDVEALKNNLTIVLDGVQDPGNLGTIIRIADWFGIKNIICSDDCVEIYNPKVVQSSMGSLLRINVFYEDIATFLPVYKEKLGIPVYGALLDGKNIFSKRLNMRGFLLLGNESRGISEELINLVDERIKIPAFGNAESLNVAIAASVLCYELRRQEAAGKAAIIK